MSYIYTSITKNVISYKVYFTHNKKKLYLGIFPTEHMANTAVLEAERIMGSLKIIPNIQYINSFTALNYKKIVSLCNFRDNLKFIKNPIYICDGYFRYYISNNLFLIFDIKDLFFLSAYKIYKRGKYIYFQDNISQQNILSRFGIQNHSVVWKDYMFKNGNEYDFRRHNLQIINSYKGVSIKSKGTTNIYVANIFIDKNIILGHYSSEIEAAIAYNKATDLLTTSGCKKIFTKNEIHFLTKSEYDEIYNNIIVSDVLTEPTNIQKRVTSNKKYRGISKDKSSYKAHIGYQNKQIYLGNYPTEKRAAQAYNYASLYIYGRKGYINSITPVVHDPDTPSIADKLLKIIPPK